MESSKAYRSIGLELSGSRNQKTSVAVLDFYPKGHRIILSELRNDLGPSVDRSGDQILIEVLRELSEERFEITGISTTAPVSLPPFFQDQEIYREQLSWIQEFSEKLPRSPRSFIPYLQRPVEFWLRHLAREKFQIGDALGSNLAPLTARLRYLEADLPKPLSETFTRGNLQRILPALKLKPELSDDYNDLDRGVQTREQIVKSLCQHLPQLFVYDWDLEKLIMELHCFNAFLAALTQHLSSLNLCEDRPRNYPKSATWLNLPQRNLRWDDALKIP